jgi:16S rRNA (cytosine1407-C5)-methyltransferase
MSWSFAWKKVMKRKRKVSSPSTASLQDSALHRFRGLISEEEYTLLLKELEHPLYPGLRVNPLKIDPQAAIQEWIKRYGWQVKGIPYCPEGFWVTSWQEAISHTIEQRLGFYYVQDAASMLPVSLFDFEGLSSPLILDMAASPGGKTTHLTARTMDHGLVIANDASLDRITALRLVLQSWGAVNTAVTHFPGEMFAAWFPDTFDRVLLDAPCSMQNLRDTEKHPVRPISENELLRLAERQKRLIESAFRAVKVGGQVVYATCTLNPEEDEAVLD